MPWLKAVKDVGQVQRLTEINNVTYIEQPLPNKHPTKIVFWGGALESDTQSLVQ
jgi:hypothetical protein